MKHLGVLPSCQLKQIKEAAFYFSPHREKTVGLTALATLTKI